MPQYFEFEATHDGLKPRVWRRFLLPVAGSTFVDLHQAIQDAGPWRDYHLWRFDAPGRTGAFLATTPGQGEPMFPGDERVPDGDEVGLESYFTPDGPTKCVYLYDFGDDWRLTVQLKQRVDHEEKFYRKLTAGRRAYPLEDCGGMPGYYACVDCNDPEILKHPEVTADDRRYLAEVREMVEGVGWRADAFELAVARQYFNANSKRSLRRPYHQMSPDTVVYTA